MTDYETIKQRLDLLGIITRETGFTMKGAHLEQCPFCSHQDCFSIFGDAKDQYKCFSCEKSGDVFTFLEDFLNMSKADALRLAAEIAHVELEAPKPKPDKAEADDEKVYRLAAGHYHTNMMAEGSQGIEWFCGKRGHFTDTLKKLQVGWATNKLLPFLQEQGIPAEDVLKYGLAKDKDKDNKAITPKDYFWHDLAIFPIIDHSGKVIAFTCKDPQKKYPGLMLKGKKKKWFLNYAALGKHQDTFIVEGENDLASLLDVGHDNVIGTAGGPCEEQITLLKNFCSNKTLYLWFDKDVQKDPKKDTGGPHHIRYIYKRLIDATITVYIISQPGAGKDPDDYIQSMLKAGKSVTEIRAAIRDLKSSALEPLAWEFEQLKALDNSKDRLELFKARELPQALNMLTSTADQEAYIDMAAKAVGVSPKAIEEQVSLCVDLYQKISAQFGGAEGIRKAEPLRLAESIFHWFNNGAGARFFKSQDKMCLFYQRKIYEIDNNLEFNTLMQRLTKLAAVEKPGSTVWYFLRNLCNLHGEPVDLMSWLYTDRERDTIYLNMNSAHNKIIRVAPNEDPLILDNGTNEHAVLLSSSPQIRSFELLQTASEAEDFAALKRLLMDSTPCEMPQKYFMVCWMISTFLMNLQGDRGLMHIIGSSGLGKSKVAERISYLIYGESYVGKGTGAAETRVATSNPILFMDNLENRNLTLPVLDLLLFIANSQHKPKAKSGSDTEVLYQKLNTMCMSTGIEPFPGKHPELINRTFPLILDHRFKTHGYMHDETVRQILKGRNLMLSSILRMIGKDVLPRLDERSDWSKKLQTDYPGHNKERNNEHICTMLIILESLLQYLPYKKDVPAKKQASEILDHWISTYEEQAQQTAVTSNTLLVLMDGLAREVLIKMRGKTQSELYYQAHNEFTEKSVKIFQDPEYLEEFFMTEPFEGLSDDEDEFTGKYQHLEFIVTAADLFTIFNRYCANQHIRNPFETPTALGARISNDRQIMESGGWEYVSRREGQAQYKKIMGKWYWRFRKTLRAS